MARSHSRNKRQPIAIGIHVFELKAGTSDERRKSCIKAVLALRKIISLSSRSFGRTTEQSKLTNNKKQFTNIFALTFIQYI